MDSIHRFTDLMLVGVRDEQDRFFAVIDLAVGKAGLIGNDHLDVILAWNIRSRDDGEFNPVDLAIKGDGANDAARDCAANGGSVPHAFTLDVVNITRCASQLVYAFLAGDGGADDAVFRRLAHGWGSAKRRTG